MELIELSRKGLEDTLATLYRASNDFDGQFREQLRPVIHQYKVIYFKLTGAQFCYHGPDERPAHPGKPQIQVLHPHADAPGKLPTGYKDWASQPTKPIGVVD